MTFLVWVYTSQDFAQTRKNFALSHDRMTVTFRSSVVRLVHVGALLCCVGCRAQTWGSWFRAVSFIVSWARIHRSSYTGNYCSHQQIAQPSLEGWARQQEVVVCPVPA